VATSVDEARTLFRSRADEVDAVVLDCVLGDADGIDLLRWIRRQPDLDGTEVVIQSAELEPDKIDAGIDCGAYYFLTKPYVPSQLKAIVKGGDFVKDEL